LIYYRAQIEEAHAKLLNRLAKKLTAAEKERGKDKQLLGYVFIQIYLNNDDVCIILQETS
jgi:hypothetical protein